MNLQDLIPIGITLVVIAIVVSMGATILNDIQSGQTAGTTAYNATDNGLEATNTLANWLPTIAIVVASAIVIGIVVSAFKM